MDTNIIWAAGFMDGEGTITIKRYRRNGRVVYQPYISCVQAAKTQANIDAIKILQQLFGGSTSRYLQKPDGMRLDTIMWSAVAQNALEAVKKLRPYLKIKGPQADLLIEYYSSIKKGTGYNKLSDEELEKRASLWTKMRLMNERGRLRLQRLSEVTLEGDATV